ncbi:hypothetical protein AMTR_s00041p00209610 [Amborella trichopoda]|uniref:Uncharacterized protein n=1 Tax=Amborella trichopoda TaxID=13333 RepID=W1PYQ1_AMBTC|nr:hypothetical protein AMTR_s00041p00209610 [Amborella trichopoda]
MIASAALSLQTTPASRGTTEPSNASDPAVVLSRSRVAILPFSSTGIPCNPSAHSPYVASLSLSAWSNVSRVTSSTACRSGLSPLNLANCGFLSLKAKREMEFEEERR